MHDGVSWADAPVILMLSFGLYASLFGIALLLGASGVITLRSMTWAQRAGSFMCHLLFICSAFAYAAAIGAGYGALYLCFAAAGFFFPLLPVLGATSLAAKLDSLSHWGSTRVYAVSIALSLLGALVTAALMS